MEKSLATSYSRSHELDDHKRSDDNVPATFFSQVAARNRSLGYLDPDICVNDVVHRGGPWQREYALDFLRIKTRCVWCRFYFFCSCPSPPVPEDAKMRLTLISPCFVCSLFLLIFTPTVDR